MVLTPSAMVPLGSSAPDFALPATTGATVARRDFAGKPLLVAFWCNHCPYVKHIADTFAEQAATYQARGVAVVAINSNDAVAYPEDDFAAMKEEVDARGYTFPYLFDETQDVAKAFDARCTPDFFLFDAQHRLFYRGQFDGARPGNNIPCDGRDLDQAVAALHGEAALPPERPSMGCNIKWRQ